MVYLHGGGWTIGDIEGWDPLCRRLANGTGCAIVSVGYRLAPEHPFPGALADALAAIGWAADELPGRLGMPLPLLIGGDSAGANLAVPGGVCAAACVPRRAGLVCPPVRAGRRVANRPADLADPGREPCRAAAGVRPDGRERYLVWAG